MTLILFDIDGTLAASSEADNRSYAAAFQKTFNLPEPSTDWHDYLHVTDVGILQELVEPQRGTPLEQADVDAFEENYLRILEKEYAAAPEGLQEVPGAKAILDLIADREDLTVAIATGGMRRTALYKLSCIGVDGEALPGGFANDAISRADIARTAMKRAGYTNGDVVYVGDGAWDAATSAELGMRFVGITRESCADRLQRHGATVTIEDYSAPERFFDAVERATVPVVT